MRLKPITSEKAVKLIDLENTLVFEVPRIATKKSIQKEIVDVFNVKVSNVRTMTRNNKKYAYVTFDKAHPASDIAAKLGAI